MTKVIVALGLVACVTIVTALTISDPVNQYNRIERARQTQYQKGVVFAYSMDFFHILAIVFVVALAGLLVIGIWALYVRFVNPYSLAEHRGYKSYIREVETRYSNTQPNFSGVHQVNYSLRDSHDNSNTITQHHKQPKQLTDASNTNTIDLLPLQQIPHIPSFKQALEQSSADSIVLGYDEVGEPVMGSLDYLYSLGNGGNTGAGKTYTTAYFAAISVAYHNADLIVIDPHAGHKGSLANTLAPLSGAYLCNVASTENEMRETIAFTQSLFNARKSGAVESQNYVILLVDEWLAVMRGSLKDDFQQLAESITQEGRKYKIIAIFMSQTWNKSKSGDMRDTLASHIVHRTRPALARQQTGLSTRELPSDLMKLENGQCYLLDIFGDIKKIRIPKVTQEDLEDLAQSIFNPSVELPSNYQTTTKKSAPIGFLQPTEVVAEVVGRTTQTQKETPTARQADIIKMLKVDKMTASKIAIELSGSKGGRSYQSALDEVYEVIQLFI